MIPKGINLVNLNEKYLLESCNEVTDFSNPDYYKNIFNQIKEICIKEHAYGCAAPHFGLSERFILIINKLGEKHYDVVPYFNPKITFMCGEQIYYEASMGIDNCIGEVTRPYYVEIVAQDINGNVLTKTAEGLEAIILCHEIDLLNGIKFTDRATNIFYQVDLEKRKNIRQYPPQITSETCTYDQRPLRTKRMVYKRHVGYQFDK